MAAQRFTERLHQPFNERFQEPLLEPLVEPFAEPFVEPLREPLGEPLDEPLAPTVREPFANRSQTVRKARAVLLTTRRFGRDTRAAVYYQRDKPVALITRAVWCALAGRVSINVKTPMVLTTPRLWMQPARRFTINVMKQALLITTMPCAPARAVTITRPRAEGATGRSPSKRGPF